MTALATGLALLPIVLGGSRPGHEIEHPMAVVIVGGLVTSTLLNLFLVPSHYLKGDPAPSWITDGVTLEQLEEEKKRIARGEKRVGG